MPTGIASPYDNNQALPGTQQTGNQSTTPTPITNTSSTVGNIPLTVAPAPTPAPAAAQTQVPQPAGMPAPVQNNPPAGTVTPPPPAPTGTPAQTAATFSPTPGAQTQGAQTQGVAREGTVAGQMDTLLKSDSPYMQQARDYALRDMNARGLANSTLAVGASQEAAIRQALPIAQQDAQTHFAQAQDNMNWLNKFAQDNNQYLQELDKMGAQIRGNYLAETGRIAEGLSADMRRNYLDQQVKARQDLNTQYTAIQTDEKLTPDQKSAASADLVSWFNTMNGWMNNSYAELSMNEIDMNVFKGLNTATGQAANQLNTPAEIQAANARKAEEEKARAAAEEKLRREGKLTGDPVTDSTKILEEASRIFLPDAIGKPVEQFYQDIRHGANDLGNQIREIF